MTIIKDQLIEAQLEVIDNASLPSGRPVGSVYYNKTTEKIQTVKQDGNLRNVFYEDEINYPVIPDHTTQYKTDLKSNDSVISTGVWQIMLSITGLIVGRTYKYDFEMLAKNEGAGGAIFNYNVNNNISAATSGTSYSQASQTVSGQEHSTPNGSRIFTATTTTINIWAKAYTGSFRVIGNTTLDINYRPTYMYLEQLPYHQAVGSFT